MSAIKKKKYFSPPTCKQINSILNMGWKLTSINAMPCLSGETISVKKENGYLLSFDKCNDNEKYYCLQKFIYYTLWSEEEYARAMEEIEEYQSMGACIISTVLGDRVYSEVIPPLLANMRNGVDVLYYIILPNEQVTKRDEKKAVDEMLTYLGLKTYPNVLFGMSLFLLIIVDVICVLWADVSFDFIFKSIAFLLPFILFCLCMKDCYYFFYYRLYRKQYSFRYQVKMLDKNQCGEG